MRAFYSIQQSVPEVGNHEMSESDTLTDEENEIGTETLAVHDALYVPEGEAQEAKATMKEVYREEYGIVPQIGCE